VVVLGGEPTLPPTSMSFAIALVLINCCGLTESEREMSEWFGEKMLCFCGKSRGDGGVYIDHYSVFSVE
jgi:hypothetical protein